MAVSESELKHLKALANERGVIAAAATGVTVHARMGYAETGETWGRWMPRH